MTVEVLYRFLQFIMKKENTGHIGPDEYNLVLPRALEDFFLLEYGLPQLYQPNRPIPPISWEVTQKIKDDLRALKVRLEGYPVDAFGKMVIPSDYVHVSAINYHYTETNSCTDGGNVTKPIPVDIFDDDKVGERLNHPYKTPNQPKTNSDWKPIAQIFDTYYQFYPHDLRAVEFIYLRIPKKPHRDYNVDANDNDTYVASGGVDALGNATTGQPSQEIELPAITHNQIARLILSYYGINLKDNILLQYAEMIKKQGV